MVSSELTPVAEEWARFLSGWSWDWFATLTFDWRRRRWGPEHMRAEFDRWIGNVEELVRGPETNAARRLRQREARAGHVQHRLSQRVWWTVAEEPHKSGRLHFHALLGGEGLAQVRPGAIVAAWYDRAGYVKLEVPCGRAAVLAYCSKYVAKGGELDIGGPLTAAPGREPSPLDAPSRRHSRKRAQPRAY